ncbi:MAG: hypothetical protein Q8O67_34015 [Deltaproteobacteria bacterium]|nr:hypothetical protein [Deltaproteobacteria bacterium]
MSNALTPLAILDASFAGMRQAVELEQAPHGIDSWGELKPTL